MLSFWGAGTMRTFRPLWVAEELGLEYTHHPIGPRTGETQTEEYTARNPKQKVPSLEHGELRMSESVAMCRYLRDVADEHGVLYQPVTATDRAREDEWIFHIYGEIDETSLYVMRRHRDLAEIYGDAPAAVESSRNYALKHLGVVADHLADHGYLVGEQFGIADVLMTSCIDWAQLYGLPVRDELMAYADRQRARDGYRRAFAINYPGLPEFPNPNIEQGE